MTNFKLMLFSFIAPLLLSLLVTPVVIKVAHKKKWVVTPKADRWHKKPTAVRGGIAIFISILIPAVVLEFRYANVLNLIPIVIMFFTGLIDDAINIKPKVKLLLQIISASLIIFNGFTFGAGLLSYFSIIITLFWIVGITNAINLLDNMDGLATGISLIISFFIGIIALKFDDYQLASLSFIVSGSCAGFLFFNFNPAKIFMGDSGSMVLGIVIAYLALALQKLLIKDSFILVFLIPLGLLSVPIIDTTLVTLRRLLSGRRIDQGGKDHLSHRLVSLGFSEKKAVIVLYLVAIIWGVNSLLLGYVDISALIILKILLAIFTVVFAITLSEIKVYSEPEETLAYKRIRGLQLGKASFIRNIIANRKMILGFLGDVIITGSSYYITLKITNVEIASNIYYMFIFISVKIITFYLFNHYNVLWRYSSSSDLLMYFSSIFASSIIILVIVKLILNINSFSFLFILIDFFITLSCIIYFRISYKFINEIMVGDSRGKRKTILYGAGDLSYIFLKELKKNQSLDYKIIGFIDDDNTKKNKWINGIKIFGQLSDLESCINKYQPEVVLVSSEKIEESKMIILRKLIDKYGLRFGYVTIRITDTLEELRT